MEGDGGVIADDGGPPPMTVIDVLTLIVYFALLLGIAAWSAR